MASEVRQKVFESMEEYRKIILPDDKKWRVLEIGIDGDAAPGGNYHFFGVGNVYETLDYLERLKPTYVQDIQETTLSSEFFDLVICSQTLEHVFNPIKAINEIFRITKKGGYAILDCPFTYPYHPSHGYNDYWRMTPAALKESAAKAGFSEITCDKSDNLLSSILVRR
jgi:SAM-dependent methyltransferase